MSPGYKSRRIDDLPRRGVSSKDGPGSVMVSDTLLPAEHLLEIKMKKSGRCHLKLVLCLFWSIISPHTKFYPNRTKNTEVGNFHFLSILVGRAGNTPLIIISGNILLLYEAILS